MFKTLERQFQRRAELLLMGRYGELGRHCRFPLHMQLLDRTVVVHSAEEYAQLMGRLHHGLCDRGVQVLLAEVSAVEVPRNDRFRVWISWEAMVSATEDAQTSMAVYQGSLVDGVFYTDRIEFQSEQITDLIALTPQLAKSA